MGKSFTGLVPSRSLIHGVNIDGTGVESFRYIYMCVCVIFTKLCLCLPFPGK